MSQATKELKNDPYFDQELQTQFAPVAKRIYSTDNAKNNGNMGETYTKAMDISFKRNSGDVDDFQLTKQIDISVIV